MVVHCQRCALNLNPTALNKYGIGLENVRTAIANANVNRPKGQLSEGQHTSEIITNDQMFHAYQYRPLIVTYFNGAPVRLSDVGQVVDSVQDVRNAGSADGKPAVVLVVFKEPGANVIQTVKYVTAQLPVLKA